MGSKIYLDSNLYIYFFEGHELYSSRIEKIFKNAVESSFQIIASPLLITELLAGPIRDNVPNLIKLYSDLTQVISPLIYVNYDAQTAKIAAKLRVKYHLPTPDCIHLATAISTKCNIYYTNDKNLKKVKEITVSLI